MLEILLGRVESSVLPASFSAEVLNFHSHLELCYSSLEAPVFGYGSDEVIFYVSHHGADVAVLPAHHFQAVVRNSNGLQLAVEAEI